MNWGKTAVQNYGPSDAKIMIVGEAPGSDEVDQGQPFVGVSGQLLRRFLKRAGADPDSIYYANLFPYQPKGNKFDFVAGTDELNESLENLKKEIIDVNPNIIIAVGGWPLYYLTNSRADSRNAQPGSGITTWRGSTLPCTLVEGFKCYITYHPAYIVRPNGYGYNPIFLNDLQRAIEESSYRELPWPKYEEIIDPDSNELGRLVDELCTSDWLTVDIETFGPKLACIGFTDSTDRAICLTYRKEWQNWEAAQQILRSKAKKNFHYGLYDINYLAWFYGWEVANYAWDTYVGMNNLFPGFPKTLAFTNSIYCRLPYYKEDRKTWKEKQDHDLLFKYNCKDEISQHTSMIGQRKDMGYVS